MNTETREQIRRTLQSIAKHYSAQMELMEQMVAIMCDEAALDPLTYLRSTVRPRQAAGENGPTVDQRFLTVTFNGRTCFLGNSLPFKMISHLVQRPNIFVPYEDLLADVWQGSRSESAVRGIVSTLRRKLRQAGMTDLADAISGSEKGHYALKLDR